MRMEESIAKHLDLMRRLGVGSSAVLVLLTHDSDRGYVALQAEPVDGGWTLEDAEIEQVQTLVIVERGEVDRALLLQVRAIAVNGVLYETISGGVKSASQNAAVKEWRFPVAPTGETWG